MLSLCLLSGLPVLFAILFGPGFILIKCNTSPLAGVLMLYILYLKQLWCQIQGARHFNDRIDTSNVFVTKPFSCDFLLLLCFGRLLAQRQRKEVPESVPLWFAVGDFYLLWGLCCLSHSLTD